MMRYGFCLLCLSLFLGIALPASAQPNIIWFSAEDLSPRIGAYGDSLARTPNIDRLAREGRLYTQAFTTAGACSPSRAAIITGMHQSSIGAHHMRTLSGAPFAPPPTPYSTVPPHYVKTFTENLRAAGYYTTNNSKEDYQFETPVTAWDESSPTAHWRNRPDPSQPFFAVFNFMATHESRVWPDLAEGFEMVGLGGAGGAGGAAQGAMPPQPPLVTDPSAVPVPPYYPDTPTVRRDIAQHYDNIARMDAQVGELLDQLEEDGVLENTIIFFWGDHGDGLPRAKRWIYDSGVHVPLVVRAPEMIPAGSVDDQLISFVDMAPTVLSLAGLEVPTHMQGRAFLGDQATQPEHEYIYAARDRFDEYYDMMRAVRDHQFKYIRNYYPDQPYILNNAFRNVTPTMREILRMHADGKLEGPQTLWLRDKRPVHELYDVVEDPHEINNLAYDPAYQDVLARMEQALDDWMEDIDDMGHISELEMVERWWPGRVQPETGAPAILPRGATLAPLSVETYGAFRPDVSGGTFDQPVEAILYSPTQGASMTYTMDSGEDARWLLYSKPIRIEETTTIRAKAIRYGYKESAETVATFTITR